MVRVEILTLTINLKSIDYKKFKHIIDRRC